MNVRPVEGFRALKTHDCITGALRHVYEFHGCPVSEELLLGLGEGIGFVYWHMKGLLPLLGGRANVGRHMDGACFAFWDGHVKWLKLPDGLTANNYSVLKVTIAH